MYNIIMTRNSAGKWYWMLSEQNGQTLATSEAYATKASCHRTARKLAMTLKLTLIVEE